MHLDKRSTAELAALYWHACRLCQHLETLLNREGSIAGDDLASAERLAVRIASGLGKIAPSAQDRQ
jgi:hypothetical protein